VQQTARLGFAGVWFVMLFFGKVFCAVTLLFAPFSKAAADSHGVLTFMYSDHEPYVISTKTGLRGFMVDYVNQIAAEGGFTVQWRNVPWVQQLPTLKRDAKNVCTITLYKNKDRLEYIRFTEPAGSSGRFVLLGAKDNKALYAYNTLKDIVLDETLIPIRQPNTVYGLYIDKLFENKGDVAVDASVMRIARSHLLKPQYYFILGEKRARSFMKNHNKSGKVSVYSHFHDLTKPIYHHIGCSQSTDDALFNSLNDGVARQGLATPN
jgi:hypothetical protein